MSAAGRYSCTATTATSVSGLQTLTFTEKFDLCSKFLTHTITIILLHVLSISFNAAVPVIIGTSLTPNPQVGQSFFIECTVDGTPMPIISWMKDGDILDEITDSRIRISVTISSSSARKSSRVEIFEATSSYNGVYECIASNEAGSTSTSFLIELLQGQSQ